VRTVLVVVLDVDVQDASKVPAADDQAMVKALLADGPDPTLGDGVGVGRPNRRADDLGTVERQTSSNALVNLVSRSRIRNLNAAARSPSATRRLRACWATHGPVEWAVTPATCTCRLPSSMTNSTYSRRGQTVSMVKKSQARMSVACRRRNDRQVVGARRGAGSMPWAPSTLRIELAEIGQPWPSSSPQTVGSPTRILPGEREDQLLHRVGNWRSSTNSWRSTRISISFALADRQQSGPRWMDPSWALGSTTTPATTTTARRLDPTTRRHGITGRGRG
jgi:hypothetical protein